ncbi:hypothetical protein RIF29_33411 [Crotalaria pallida]|uniref:Uncharacterized protein n=1 Tax=Crotalaria pallida TaxID=3830 RepID=A0AAN9E836_CROPI
MNTPSNLDIQSGSNTTFPHSKSRSQILFHSSHYVSLHYISSLEDSKSPIANLPHSRNRKSPSLSLANLKSQSIFSSSSPCVFFVCLLCEVP